MHTGRHSQPERVIRPERVVDAPPQWMTEFRGVWAGIVVMYATIAIILIALPAALLQTSVEASASFDRSAEDMLSGEYLAAYSPETIWLKVVEAIAGKPEKEPWVPSGIYYGNTRVPVKPETAPICMAWQYRPKTLAAVPKGVTALAPTWFYVEDAGGVAEVNALDELLEVKISNWQPMQYIKTAHDGGAQVWATVVCIGTPKLARQIVTDEACRARFISRVTGWVQEYGLDGINFDFEKMYQEDAAAFTDLVDQCKQALPPGKVVSVSVTVPLKNPEGNLWQCYDREGLGRVADYVAVMTYDNPDLQPVAAIDWVEGKVNDMLDAVPGDKLLLGIPFYGVDFIHQLPEGTGRITELPAMAGATSRKTMTPSGVTALLNKGSYTSGGKEVKLDYWVDQGTWLQDKAVMQYIFVDTDRRLHLIYCEESQSLEAKGRLLAFERLGGAAVWRMEFGSEPLWDALGKGMNAVK